MTYDFLDYLDKNQILTSNKTFYETQCLFCFKALVAHVGHPKLSQITTNDGRMTICRMENKNLTP